jgi:hypothetical protein
MEFEAEAEQSLPRSCRQTNERSKRTHQLTSSIVPRGTSFHRSAELECSPIEIDPARFSCHCDSPGPLELGTADPYAMHDHGEAACQGYDCLLHSAVPGDLHCPGLEPGPFRRTHQHYPCRSPKPLKACNFSRTKLLAPNHGGNRSNDIALIIFVACGSIWSSGPNRHCRLGDGRDQHQRCRPC